MLATLLPSQPMGVGVRAEAIRVEESIHAQPDAVLFAPTEMISRLGHTFLEAFAADVREQLLRVGQRDLMLQLAHYLPRLPLEWFAVHQCVHTICSTTNITIFFPKFRSDFDLEFRFQY